MSQIGFTRPWANAHGGASGPPHITYGNYGGQNWSGGRWHGNPNSVDAPPPVNQLDAAFRNHDIGYENAISPADIYRADRQLLDNIDALRGNPSSDWHNGTMDTLDQWYGGAAYSAFKGRVSEYERDNNIPLAERWRDPKPYPDIPPYPFPERGYIPPNPLDPPKTDPLVLDLDGDGIELLSVTNSGAYFDFDSDGFLERAGWVGSDDGFLAIDLNGNGRIDNLSELFGSDVTDGFDLLTPYDTSGDGIISSADEKFGQLQIWRDLDGDGYTDAGEMEALSAAGIQSIGLAKTPSDNMQEGNRIAFTGLFTRTNGTTAAVAAVFFENNQTLSRWEHPEGFQVSEDTETLPFLSGYGTLKNLDVAMTLDSSLLSKVQSLVYVGGTMPSAQLRSAFEQMLYDWANIQSASATGRGSYVDGQHLAFVEAFYGSHFEERLRNGSVNTDPSNVGDGDRIEQAFNDIVSALLTRFFAQVPASQAAVGGGDAAFLQSVFVGLSYLFYDRSTDMFQGDFSEAFGQIAQRAPSGMAAALAYYDTAFSTFVGTATDFFRNDRVAFLAKVEHAAADFIADVALRGYVKALAAGSIVRFGTGASESISGDAASDVIWSKLGDDVMRGHSGDDTYVYARGDGNDTIEDSSRWGGAADKLLLTDINPNAVTVERSSDDVVLIIAPSSLGGSDGGRLTLAAQLDANVDKGVEQVVFADGTVWSADDLRQRVLARYSTDGNDVLDGFNTPDVLQAGRGDDVMRGHYGNDTYVYARGDGNDTIEDSSRWGGTADKLLLTDINPGAVKVERNGDDAILVIAPTSSNTNDSGRITVKSSFTDYFEAGVEIFAFSDGTQWSRADLRRIHLATSENPSGQTLRGTVGPDTLTGGAGNDRIFGGAGNDTLDGGSGSDHLFGEEGDDLLLLSASNSGNMTVLNGGAGNDTVSFRNFNFAVSADLAFDGPEVSTKDRSNLQGGSWRPIVEIEQVENLTGTAFSDDLYGNAANNVLSGLDGADRLYGRDGDDTLDGGDGNDELYGGAGRDTLYGGLGNDYLDGSDNSGNQANYDGRFFDYTVTGNTNGTVTISNVYYGTDTLANIQQVRFYADNRTYTTADLLSRQNENRIAGTAANDVLNGTDGNDYIVGNGGRDTLYGGRGNDNLDGSDTSGNQADYDGRLIDYTVTGNADGTITVDNGYFGTDTLTNIQYIRFHADNLTYSTADLLSRQGGSRIIGTSGDDTLIGTDANDYIAGGAGQDILYGGLGNDYLDGSDASGNRAEYDGRLIDYAVTSNPDGTITVSNGYYGIDTLANIRYIRFYADNLTYSTADLLSRQGGSRIIGTAGNDTLNGTDANDYIAGGAGQDILYGGLGNDYLDGSDSSGNRVDYDGRRSDYAITKNADGTLTVSNAYFGTDTLANIQQIRFHADNRNYDVVEV